jgi:hypothetical protein
MEHPLVVAITLLNKAKRAKAHPAIIKNLEQQVDKQAEKSASKLSNCPKIINSLINNSKLDF